MDSPTSFSEMSDISTDSVQPLQDCPINPADLDYQTLSLYFHMPMREVAAQLGICTTILKKVCRDNGIPRWPYRQITSLNRMVSSMDASPVELRESATSGRLRGIRSRKVQSMEAMVPVGNSNSMVGMFHIPMNSGSSSSVVPSLALAPNKSRSANASPRSPRSLSPRSHSPRRMSSPRSSVDITACQLSPRIQSSAESVRIDPMNTNAQKAPFNPRHRSATDESQKYYPSMDSIRGNSNSESKAPRTLPPLRNLPPSYHYPSSVVGNRNFTEFAYGLSPRGQTSEEMQMSQQMQNLYVSDSGNQGFYDGNMSLEQKQRHVNQKLIELQRQQNQRMQLQQQMQQQHQMQQQQQQFYTRKEVTYPLAEAGRMTSDPMIVTRMNTSSPPVFSDHNMHGGSHTESNPSSGNSYKLPALSTVIARALAPANE